MLFALTQEGLMPHGMCYLWQPELLWMHVFADAAIALAYFAIPPTIMALVVQTRRRIREKRPAATRLPYESVFWMFSAFIVACGVTHVLGVVTVWNPIYWVSGTAKVATATISLITATTLPFMVPRISELFVNTLDVEAKSRELSESNAFLERLAEELGEANEARRHAMRTMAGWLAHDLNNRLQGMQGSAELIAIDDDPTEGLELLQAEVGRAAATIQNLQIIAGSAALGATELVDLVAAVRAATASFSDPRIRVDLPERLEVNARPDYVPRILHELLQNAIEGADPETLIQVTARRSGVPQSEVEAYIEVTNSSTDLSPRLRESLFDPFVSTKSGRSGLGLAIARRLSIEMGGMLSASFEGSRIRQRLAFHRADLSGSD